MEFELFQTLDTRYEIDKTESQGPVKCTKDNNAWLGHGYYFWEEDISLAHGWGVRHYNETFYCICKTVVIYDEKKCLDLIHNPYHRKTFRLFCEEIKEKNDYEYYEDMLVSEVFDYLNKFNKPWMANFEAVRVYGENSFKDFSNRIRFDNVKTRNNARLTLNPEIQWCLFRKDSMKRKGFELVFPDESDYVCFDKSRNSFY